MSSQIERSKTIVSVTPLAVLADSRTFKEASSFSRFGYSSIVVEGKKSPLSNTTLPFQLRSIQKKENREVNTFSKEEEEVSYKSIQKHGKVKTVVKRCLKVLPEFLKNPLNFGLFLCLYFYQYCLLTLISTPKASLYYLHAPFQFPAIFLLSRWYQVPFIYDAHDFYIGIEEYDRLPALRRSWIFPFYQKMESWCIKKAAAVVTVSKGIAKLQKDTFGCNPIVIRNSQDTRLDREQIQPLREYLGLNQEIFLLVTIGQAKKGQEIQGAFKAIAELPEFVHLAFVGNNYEPFVKYLDTVDLQRRVHFIPSVHPYEVVPFVRSANASLLLYYLRSANYEYCLPNGLFQAIAAELPLLYPQLPEISEIAKKNDLGIPIDPKNPRSISLAIQTLLENPSEIERFKRNLKEVKYTLNWEQEERILKRLILDVLGHQG